MLVPLVLANLLLPSLFLRSAVVYSGTLIVLVTGVILLGDKSSC
jgi:hypothetical protein